MHHFPGTSKGEPQQDPSDFTQAPDRRQQRTRQNTGYTKDPMTCPHFHANPPFIPLSLPRVGILYILKQVAGLAF